MPDTPDSTPSPTLLAFDFGLRRIGIAVGQSVTRSASPLTTVGNRAAGPDWAVIDRLVAEWRPARLIVGMPRQADGGESPVISATRQFIEALSRYSIPVETVDERLSSLEARERLVAERRRGLRRRLKKDAVDAASAVIIAERWLNAAP